MPALRAFRRRWNVGSDDLVFPGLVEISVRVIWFVILFIFYMIKRRYVTCDYAQKIRIFYIGTICLLAAQIILGAILTTLSSRGTMVNKHARKHVSTVLYLRLAFFIPEVAWAIIGTVWTFAFERGVDCPKLLVKSGEGVVLIEWMLIVSIITTIILTFDPLGRRHMRKRSLKDYNQVWHRRCRVLCCCIWGDENRQGAFEEIADMLTTFFKYKDIVLSDVIAGLVLLHMRGQSVDYLPPKSDSHQSTTSPPSKTTDGSDCSNFKDWMTLENVEYYCKYAVGSYGRYNYVMCRNCRQRCGLCRRYKTPCQSSPYSQDKVIGDNSCQCHMAAVLQYTGIDPDDVIFANFENQIYETPYYVAVDDPNRSIVISLRGTKSFQDAVTDLTAMGEPFETAGVPAGFVHGGMLQVARNIKEQLDQSNILDKIPEGYNLVLTGHSLGAGAAVLLSLMLISRFPELKCFAYSPPGGLVSTGLQMYTESFVLSVVLGNDVIPRLSLTSMENLKYALLDAIKKSKLPKYKILATGVIAVCCGWRENIAPEDSDSEVKQSASTNNLFDMTEESIRQLDLHSPNDANDKLTDRDPEYDIEASDPEKDASNCREDTDCEQGDCSESDPVSGVRVQAVKVDVYRNLRRHREIVEPKIRPTTYQQFYQSHMKWRREREKINSIVADPLYLPGNVLHLVEEPTVMQLTHPRYHIRWARPKDFCEIMVSPNMLHHHHGYIMRRVLQRIIAEKSRHDKSTLFINNHEPGSSKC